MKSFTQIRIGQTKGCNAPFYTSHLLPYMNNKSRKVSHLFAKHFLLRKIEFFLNFWIFLAHLERKRFLIIILSWMRNKAKQNVQNCYNTIWTLSTRRLLRWWAVTWRLDQHWGSKSTILKFHNRPFTTINSYETTSASERALLLLKNGISRSEKVSFPLRRNLCVL